MFKILIFTLISFCLPNVVGQEFKIDLSGNWVGFEESNKKIKPISMDISGIYPNFTFEEFFPQTSEVTSCPMYVEILAIENSRTYEVNIIQELETDFSKLKIVNEDSIILNYTILPNDPRELGISLKLKRNK